MTIEDQSPRPVPLRALVLSMVSLAIPVASLTVFPQWLTEEQSFLLWLTVLVPPFLLTYYRGWKGASVGLAGGMAALVITHLALLLGGAQAPDHMYILWITATYIVVCVGVGVLAELLERERRAAAEMALTDALTGLPNRRHASIFLDAAFSAAARGRPMCVVLFDLDHFKGVNDRFGHAAGDAALKRFGAILAEVTRRMDLTARWGGEEFISILSNCQAAGAVVFTDRILTRLREERFPWGAVTVSAGIAEFESGMGSPELLVATADRALYSAKSAGRDRHVVAGVPETSGRVQSSLDGSLPDESSPPRARPGERLLVVDDHDQARRGVVRFLTQLGYEVFEAAGGSDAIGAARTGIVPDLILTDLVMPEMSGFTLIERLEAEFGPQRILYMSGHVQGEVSWGGAPGALVSFVAKPMAPGELAGRVRDLLDQAVT